MRSVTRSAKKTTMIRRRWLAIAMLSFSLVTAQTNPKKPPQKNTPTTGTLMLTFGAAVNNPEGQAAAEDGVEGTIEVGGHAVAGYRWPAWPYQPLG